MCGVAAALTGCTPSATGFVGLYLNDSGAIQGVVHNCRATVSTFDGWQASEAAESIGRWPLPDPVDRTATAPIGTQAEVVDLIGDRFAAGFAASTPGEANATLTLWVSAGQVAAMEPGQVLYSTMDESGDIAVDTTDIEGFAALSCSPFD